MNVLTRETHKVVLQEYQQIDRVKTLMWQQMKLIIH